MTATVTRLRRPENRLADLRYAAGINRRDLARRLGVDAATIERWEDRTQSIPERHKVELATLFGVTVEHLMCAPWEDD